MPVATEAPVPNLDLLTTRQRAVLDFIIDHIKDEQMPPTVREIMAHMGMKNPNGVMCHIRALRKKRIIGQSGFGFSRGIRLNIGKTCTCCDGLGLVLPAEKPQ